MLAKYKFFFPLQEDILDVNQIFKDLGMLVHEQGEVIGNFAFVFCQLLLYFWNSTRELHLGSICIQLQN